MSKKTLFILSILLGFFGSLFGIDGFPRRECPIKMTTSVVVPCVPKHFHHLYGLLYQYSQQTCPPDQIVVSLSQAQLVGDEEIDGVEQFPWPFELIILKTREMKSPGGNRALACDRTTGDIILFQDADDVPHPQRVEIIKYIFENYHVDHLMHGFFLEFDEDYDYNYEYLAHLKRGLFSTQKDFPFYKPEWLQLERYEYYEDVIAAGNIALTNGNPCVSREVIEQIRWDNHFEVGEDGRFNRGVYKAFKNNGIVRAFLYKYRKTLSSYSRDRN